MSPTRFHIKVVFVYGAITCIAGLSRTVPLTSKMLKGLIPVRSPLLGNLG